MWTRKELKTKSKIRFRGTYWKSVLTALILMFIMGGLGSSGSGMVSGMMSGGEDGYDSREEQEIAEDFSKLQDDSKLQDEINPAIIVAAIIALVIFLVLIPLQVFIFNPLEIGCDRFFIKNLKEDAQVREICYAFDNGYKNNVKTLFFRDVFTFLWMLLFIIPGIIKSYEYQMIPYILAENPGMDRKEAFARSKKMMNGNKWKAFLLDLSFFGWYLLNGLTLGILGIFYLNPYVAQTQAAFYEAIKEQ